MSSRLVGTRARRLANRVAERVLHRARDAAVRLVDLADRVRPALGPANGTPIRVIEVVPVRERPTAAAPAPPPPAAPPPPEPPAEPAAWVLAAHLRRTVDGYRERLLGPSPFDGADPTLAHDPEALRTLRVASRRLRAFVEVFGDQLPDKPRRRLRRDLRAVGRALGPLREWDMVATELEARRARTDDPIERAGLEHVLEWVERRRERARRQSSKALDAIDRAGIGPLLDEALDRLIGPWTRPGFALPSTLWSMLGPRMKRAFAAAPMPASLSELEAVHEVRIQMKRLRYAFELLDPAFVDGAKPLRRPLKRVQRVIGTSRDLGQLLALLRGRAAKLDPQARPVLSQGLAAVIRDLEASWHRCQAAIEPVLRELDEARLAERTQRALGLQPAAYEVETSAPGPHPVSTAAR